MRIYEELFIIRPDAPEEEIDQLIEQLTTYIAVNGGNVDKSEKWGVRKLAYRVQKRNEGFYVLLQFTAKPETVRELERRLRVTDSVMKFLTVRVDEKMKKMEKRKKAREKRAARKPAACRGGAEPAFRRACDGRRGRTRRPSARRAHARCAGRKRKRCKETIMAETKRRTAHQRDRMRPTGGDKAIATKKQYFRRKKVCRFCVEKIDDINYKDVRLLTSFISERGKIVPRRISGVCTPHQRRLSQAIKQARNIALIPFASAV